MFMLLLWDDIPKGWMGCKFSKFVGKDIEDTSLIMQQPQTLTNPNTFVPNDRKSPSQLWKYRIF